MRKFPLPPEERPPSPLVLGERRCRLNLTFHNFTTFLVVYSLNGLSDGCLWKSSSNPQI